MASFVKRGNKWRVEVAYKGERFTATFASKTEAKEWASRKEISLKSYRSGSLGKWKTVGDALDRYMKEVSSTKKGERWEVIRLTKLGTYDIASIRLDDLQPADVAIWRDRRLNEVSASSVRREMGLMGAVFTMCCTEWNWLAENPIRLVRRPKEPKGRERRIADAEVKALCQELGYHVGTNIRLRKQLVGAYFLLAIETGMRLGELCSLNSYNVFLPERYVALSDTKNSDTRNVPLSSTAIEILKDILASGVRVTSATASALFRKAKDIITADEDRIDILDLTFHDTRHEATTRLAKKLEIMELAKMIGHRDLKSLMIYYNPTPTEIAEHLD